MTKPGRQRLVLVFDTSPLIVLVEELDLVPELLRLNEYVDLLVPDTVAKEYGKEIPSFFKVLKGASNSVEIPGLGPGETSAIQLSLELRERIHKVIVILVTDDKKAKKTCESLGLECIGTLGVLELLKVYKVLNKNEVIEIIKNIDIVTSLYITEHIKIKVIEKVENQGLIDNDDE